MTDTETKALQAKEKAEVTSQAEQTRPGMVFTPAVDIFETDKEITLYEAGEDKQSLYELGNPYIQVVMGFKDENGEIIVDEFAKPVTKTDFLKNIVDENGVLREGYENAVLLKTYKMRAKDVAEFCLLCGLCSKNGDRRY